MSEFIENPDNLPKKLKNKLDELDKKLDKMKNNSEKFNINLTNLIFVFLVLFIKF